MLADPRSIERPLLYRMYYEFEIDTAPGPMERMASLIRTIDAVLVVSAEYNHGIPAALENLLNHFSDHIDRNHLHRNSTDTADQL